MEAKLKKRVIGSVYVEKWCFDLLKTEIKDILVEYAEGDFDRI